MADIDDRALLAATLSKRGLAARPAASRHRAAQDPAACHVIQRERPPAVPRACPTRTRPPGPRRAAHG